MLNRPTVDYKDSFRSYVASSKCGHSKVAAVEPNFRPLKGELVSSRCDDVLLDRPFKERIFGALVCTNFRLCFVPLFEKTRDPCSTRNIVFGDDYELPLCSVEGLFYSSHPITKRTSTSTKRFRQMTSPASQLDIISCIKIFAKDFRVWIFDLQRSQSAVNLANNIYHFSHPKSLANFFHVPESVHYNGACPGILFNDRNDWIAELHRCNVDESIWRVCFLHLYQSLRKCLVRTYPTCVVVPSDTYDFAITEYLVPNWNNGRFPIWCWSSANGSALLRSSMCCHDLSSSLWEKILTPLCNVHPQNKRPRLVTLEISASQICNCYGKLHALCSIESMVQLVSRNKDWCSLLAETGWCQLVFECLSEASVILHDLIDNQRSVIVADEDGYNASVVVSCLVQICGDRFYRTIPGFSSLIEKEWVSLGHPFGKNIFGCESVYNKDQLESLKTTPTFLVFLDAVWQLLRLFPFSFEYSQYMLIALWDISITGLCPNLTYNCVSDRLLALEVSYPIFPLSQYYSSKYCAMFTNATYSVTKLFALDPSDLNCIRPPSCPFDVEFWNDCYLRWIPFVNVKEGGNISKELAMCSLLSLAASAATSTCETSQFRRQLHPAFDFPNVTSAFPYSDDSLATFIQNDDEATVDDSSVKSLVVQSGLDFPSLSTMVLERRFSGSYVPQHSYVMRLNLPRFSPAKVISHRKKGNRSPLSTFV